MENTLKKINKSKLKEIEELYIRILEHKHGVRW